MRISELSASSGVSIPTIKYYLRERLIPQGEITSPTRADYDVQHVDALRLVRSLVTAGLSIAQVRQVVEWMQQPITSPADLLTLLGSVNALISGGPSPDTTIRPETAELVASYGWYPEANRSAVAELQAAWDAAEEAGFETLPQVQALYARTMTEVARVEIDHFPSASPTEMVRYSVLGSLLMERVLLAMRRVAEASLAVEALGGPAQVARMHAASDDAAQASETSSE